MDNHANIRLSALEALLTGALLLSFGSVVEAQYGRTKKSPDASQRATTSQVIGVDTEITFVYHRPGVRGRDVWTDKSLFRQIGKLVPFNGDPRPWRAGANETTTVTFESDVLVEGHRLAAGTYGLFVIPTEQDWLIVFSQTWQSWGSFSYDPSNDVLRVSVTPEQAEFQEWLSFGFDRLKAYSARAFVRWEKKKVPFLIEIEHN